MDKIKLGNRYHGDNYLERIEGDKWKLCLGNSDDDSYTRVGLLEGKNWEDKDYRFVDPPGGPFISVGSEISGMIVYKITAEGPGYIVYLKEEEKKEKEK